MKPCPLAVLLAWAVAAGCSSPGDLVQRHDPSTPAAVIPAQPGSHSPLPIFAAFTLLGGLAFATRRRKPLRPGLLALIALLTLSGSITLTGCGGSGSTTTTGPATHTAAAGTYTIPVTLTPAVSGSTNTLNLTLVVQ